MQGAATTQPRQPVCGVWAHVRQQGAGSWRFQAAYKTARSLPALSVRFCDIVAFSVRHASLLGADVCYSCEWSSALLLARAFGLPP